MKISIITPVYNQVDFIEQTILSVLNQNYSNLEYIIIDGGSTDGTLEIIKKYESKITKWISEPDRGMYDALNKGFKLSTGDIMGWINGDDVLFENALQKINGVFQDLPSVQWIQGMNCAIDMEGNIIDYRYGKKFSIFKFLNKDYKYIQQESTFWKRDLYIKAGNFINSDLKLAGDFELWFRFAQFAKLYNTNFDIGKWRERPDQLSRISLDKYNQEAEEIIDQYNINNKQKDRLCLIRKWRKRANLIKRLTFYKLRLFNKLITKLYELDKLNIEYSTEQSSYIIKP